MVSYREARKSNSFGLQGFQEECRTSPHKFSGRSLSPSPHKKCERPPSPKVAGLNEFHYFSMTGSNCDQQKFWATSSLAGFFDVLSTNKDKNGLRFISTIEGTPPNQSVGGISYFHWNASAKLLFLYTKFEDVIRNEKTIKPDQIDKAPSTYRYFKVTCPTQVLLEILTGQLRVAEHLMYKKTTIPFHSEHFGVLFFLTGRGTKGLCCGSF